MCLVGPRWRSLTRANKNWIMRRRKWGEKMAEQRPTHGHTRPRGEVAVVSAPGSNGSVPKHLQLPPRTRRRVGALGNFSRVSYVYVPDEPFQRRTLDHWWWGRRLNGCETIDSWTETVRSTRGKCTSRGSIPDHSGSTGECGLSSPDIETLVCKFQVLSVFDDFAFEIALFKMYIFLSFNNLKSF